MQLNTQPVEPQVRGDGRTLDVIDVWRTIQGEGPFAGMRAVFIRLAGCNLRCPACDTDYTTGRRTMSLTDIMAEVYRCMPHDPLVVLTGGEPFRQSLVPLCQAVSDVGGMVQIETNGTVWQPLPYDPGRLSIVCSPKTPRVHHALAAHVTAYKYVLRHAHLADDGLPTDTLGGDFAPARPPAEFPRQMVFVQPLDEGDEARNALNLQSAVTSCMCFGWRLSVQLHKICCVP